MKLITQEQLVKKFPQIFLKIKHIECDSGWFALIYNMCLAIEHQIKYFVPEDLGKDIYAVQIKEKFGGLRAYFNTTTPFIDGVISMAEAMSYEICEVCGEPGMKRLGNWVQTLCDKHDQDKKNSRK